MPSKTERRIDATDVKILTLLQEDGRRSYTSMAEILGISEANVRQRTKRLLRRQIIAIVAVADPISLGFGIMASIGVRLTGPGRDRAAEQVAENPEISHLVLCTGSVDLQAEVVCRDREHLLSLTERIAKIHGVELGETRMYLRTVKENEQWLTSGADELIQSMLPS
ncbi:MAG: Lrp/AsnC family transcriptional regulator, regulator for asnA, asnC and gidA [Actinomycetota bacterium]|jgi:Lrp/AsnC family transcriptional regulator for asnA, asnC and gidA|nr:Lrp/AsnC family transcriptional regulator, regulator for asnA, asnC and gidA [Actinomycetota bacterium]